MEKTKNEYSKFYKDGETVQSEIFCEGGCADTMEKGGNVLFDQTSAQVFVDRLKSEIKAPYVKANYSTLGGEQNISILLTISSEEESTWANNILENSRYAKIHIYKNGTIEKISGTLPKFRKMRATSQEAVIEKLGEYASNPEKFMEGAVVGEGDEQIQTPYFPASEVCNTLDTVVPNAMAIEQKRFNQRFKTAISELGMTVEEWVGKKLHYKSVEELCYDEDKKDASGRRIVRFSQEQIDAIGTAIWNYENSGDAIIIADQTGVGKGRQAAGILRYAILELKVVPFFFTEKKHLINDIYRDLIAIGFEAGIPFKYKEKEVIEKTEFSDVELLDIIQQDIKDTEDVRVEYIFPEEFELGWIRKSLDDTHARYDEVETVKEELIELYRQKFIEEGYERDVYKDNPDYDKQVVEALRKGKHQLRPFIPNKIDAVKDIDGNILYEGLTKPEISEIVRMKKDGRKYKEDPNIRPSDIVLPNKFKLIATTYSQVGTAFYDHHGKKELKNKIKLFQKYAMNSVLVLDESHTASGLKGSGELSNTAELIFKFVQSAKMTTYLSATYAKRADNMPLYALRTSIRESGLSDMEMVDAFVKGGNSLQEAVSAELTRNGQLLRREKTIQGESDYYYESAETDTGKNQIAKLNRIAGLYSKVLDFADKVRQVIREHKATLDPDEKAKIKNARGVNALAFQLFNFMLLGLKIRQTTEFAIKKLNEGRKTIITVANTMESALDNLSKTFASNTNADSYKMGDKIKNDFALYMAFLLNYTMRYNNVEIKVDDEGNETEVKTLIYVLDSEDDLSDLIKERLLGEYQDLIKEILSADTGIPIAPLDMIKKAIKDAGFSVNEITGRQRQIVFGSDTSEGTITKREIRKTDVVVREFNENDIDCLLINQSGAVGISMHAYPNKKVNKIYETTVDDQGNVLENAPTSLENKKEVKKRAMVITQMELDINKEVQKLGRINRTGQVYQPEYTYVISAIPSESRLTALMEKKLRSLSSNVSSNQEQASYLFSSDDFFSDVAVSPFNETMQDIGMRQVTVQNGKDIQNFTKSLYFRDYQLQKDFYDTFQKRLQKEIETLTAQGLYTGKMTSKDYFAETLATFPFFIGDNNAKTSFGRHSFIEKVNVKLYREKYTEKKIAQQITDHLKLKNTGENVQGGGTPVEDSYFSKLTDFQAKAIERLDGFESSKRQLIDKIIEDHKLELLGIDVEAKKYEAELKKFGKLQKALDLEMLLKKANEDIIELTQKITESIASGNTDALNKHTAEMAPLQASKKAIEKKLEPLAEILKTKSDHKDLLREIEKLQTKKERIQRYIDNENTGMTEYNVLIARAKEYVNRIGQIMQLTVFDEHTEMDENGWEPKQYTYTQKFAQQVVVTGISFPYGYYDLTQGKFEIHLSGVSEKYTYNLYKLHKEFKEEDKMKGMSHTDTLTIISPDYIGKWGVIAGQTDNSYREDRYIIIGSLLKTFTLGKNNDISGQIIKYNTKDGKTRIGIEVADNKDQESGRKSVYKILEQRYSADNNLQHPIYYDGNQANVKKFIEEYIYHHLFENLYATIRLNTPADDRDYLDRNNNVEYVFQISSSERAVFVVVTLDDKVMTQYRDLVEKYNDGETKIKINEVDRETFSDHLSVQIVADSIPTCDFFAWHLQESGVEITSENYTIGSKSKTFPNVEPERYGGKTVGRLSLRGGPFSTFFPTNLIMLEEYVNYGIKYPASLKMKYEQFIGLIQIFEKKRRKQTFATASNYFDKHKGEYVFEQFSDEIEMAKSTGEKITFTPDEGGAEKEISEMIDQLVQMLTREII